MASVPMTEGKRLRAVEFGADKELLGVINDAEGPLSSIGGILWGLGVAELKTARRLAKHGIPSLQVRLNGTVFYDRERRNAAYEAAGVAYCRTAMDKLAADRGVSSFILMGNCACATLCFATAMQDPRVTGLILTNPYVGRAQQMEALFWSKLRRGQTWKNLLTGRTRVRGSAGALKSLLIERYRKRRQGSPMAATAASPASRVFGLPADLEAQLAALADRGVAVLIACSTNDDSLGFLRARHGAMLANLQAARKLTFEVVSVTTHVFSTDDEASAHLNSTISRWLEDTFIPRRLPHPAGV